MDYQNPMEGATKLLKFKVGREKDGRGKSN
jgi:hypothetical protein